MQTDKINFLTHLFVVTGLLGLLVSLVVILIYFYQQKSVWYTLSIEKLQVDHEKDLLNLKIEIQENTFQDIAREIHDNINLSLTLAKLQLNALLWEETEKHREVIVSTMQLITKSLESLRNISRSLNSDIISTQGLTNAIQEEINRITATGLIQIVLDVHGKAIFMDSQKELIVFRTIQEAFNNILKHASASMANVNLDYQEMGLRISIKDDGVGFQFQSFKEMAITGRSGLKNMESRLKALNGSIQVKTRPNLGTQLLFYIPY